MDDRRFDSLVKALAAGKNRRSVLKGLLGLGGAAAIGGTLQEDSTEAARRPSPTPTPHRCPGNQTWNGTKCACPQNLSQCVPGTGPACCNDQVVDPGDPGYSECCDNACCQGTCYGEELCCPTNKRGAAGQLPPLAEYCRETNECCLAPDFCCNIDGCCSTVCWGGNFDDDFCCPAENLCPGGATSPDRCCTNNTTCCGGGTDENSCADLSNGGCCDVSDCGPTEEGACGWECSQNQCISVSCTEGEVCCEGECVSSVDFQVCSSDPDGCCATVADTCCGTSGCCALGQCNAGQECCDDSQFACGLNCCDRAPGAQCCGGNTCCTEGKCAASGTCCTGDDIACVNDCCPEERCTAGVGCCAEGFLACSGGICCSAAVYQCATEGPGCECLPGTEACSELPGGCCPTGQCNDAFQCCDAGTTPCGDVCCDNSTQTCNGQGICVCDSGLIPCGDTCIDAQCCGTDNSLCTEIGLNLACVECFNGECSAIGFQFNSCEMDDGADGYCSNGECLACIPFRENGCTVDGQCCTGSCLGGRCDTQ